VAGPPHEGGRGLVELTIQVGEVAKAGHDRPHDEGQEGQLLVGGEALVEAPPDLHQLGHVALFDEGEVGGRRRGAGHVVPDPPPEAPHRDRLVFIGRCGRRGR